MIRLICPASVPIVAPIRVRNRSWRRWLALVGAVSVLGVSGCSDDPGDPVQTDPTATSGAGAAAGAGAASAGQGGMAANGAGAPTGAGAGATAGAGAMPTAGSADGGMAGAAGAAPNAAGMAGGADAAGAGNVSAGTGNASAGAAGDSAGAGMAGADAVGGAAGAMGAEAGAAGEAQGMLDYTEPVSVPDEDGGKLWLRYPVVPVAPRLDEYQAAFTNIVNTGSSDTLSVAADELVEGLSGLTGTAVAVGAAQGAGDVIIGKVGTAEIDAYGLNARVTPLGSEGYLVEAVASGDGVVTVVTGNTDIGVLYGTYALLRYLSMHGAVTGLSLTGAPKIQNRILNHWDNLDRTVERGYAGQSLWNWNSLPGTISQRYIDYARANASIGINGTVLTNVNATKNNNEDMWGSQRAQYFQKVAALADAFRPYGIRVYLTAPFNAAGNANPNDATTRQWWVDRMNEIYALIPDFGGLLIKASSEGEPGPSNGATHADGANMLAQAIGDRGLVMWRAFVYSENVSSDRIRQADDEFKPLDGDFDENVLVQVKNGPLDFQPREPVHPMFGDMDQTQIALELQITKEYLGQDTHLAYVGAMYEEILQTDTYADGAGSTVARVIDGTVHNYQHSAIAGVSNVGSDVNWTGSHFNQANWYAFGRMAWDPDASATTVAEEWVRQTLSNDPDLVAPVTSLMMASHQTLVDYMTPLGLVHIMGTDHHYGPMPWESTLDRPEWNPTYYHNANAQGIGFDRTSSGSNALEQYREPLRGQYASRDTVGEDFLLFFHRVGWDDTLDTGRTVWEELVHRYSLGVDGMQTIRDQWATAAQGRIDGKRFQEIADFLEIQHWEARWWRDACLTYFADQSGHQIPAGYAQPLNNLSFYMGLSCPTNRDKPRCSQVYNVEASPAILP